MWNTPCILSCHSVGICGVVSQFCSELLERRVVRDLNRQSSRNGHFHRRKRGDMSALRRLRNFWIPCVTTIVLGCFSDAVAQVRYQVTDLGTLNNDNFSCAMAVNSHGWTEIQDGELDALGNLVKGQVAINVDGFTFPLPTLGGPNNWDNPFGGEINDRGEAVGYSETDVLDPNGEDFC